MAWPPASSSTWSVRTDLGSGTSRATELLYINDNLIYTRGTHIDEYDSDTGIRTRIGTNPTDFEATSQVNLTMAYFKSQLYTRSRVISAPLTYSTRGYVYDGTPNNWTRVWDDGHGGGSGNQARLVGDNNYMIAYRHSGDIAEKHTAPALGTWTTLTLSPSVSVIGIGGNSPNALNNNDSNIAYFFIDSGVPTYVYKINANGTASRVGNDLASISYKRTPGYHWRGTGGGWEWSTDCITWNIPATTPAVQPFIIQNYTKTFGFLSNQVYFWDDNINDWSTTVDSATPWGIDSYVLSMLSDGTPIIGGVAGSTPFIMERDDPVDIAYVGSTPSSSALGNLWVYRTNDKGDTWTSKGIYA